MFKADFKDKVSLKTFSKNINKDHLGAAEAWADMYALKKTCKLIRVYPVAVIPYKPTGKVRVRTWEQIHGK